MHRDPRAYLSDILDAIQAIESATTRFTPDQYETDRLYRSAVEREFIIIGEAMNALSAKAPDIFRKITNARRIISFRNQLTHEYLRINNQVVLGVIQSNLPLLQSECKGLLETAD
jgi:uncharacterized protein with HEPN domain